MRVWWLIALLTGQIPSVAAQSNPPSAATRTPAVQQVSIAPGPVVVIAASGALPAPSVGTLHSPERIYVDLPGVSARPSSVAGTGELVGAIRIAQHSVNPLVARVVIDLKQPSRYAIDTTRRESGRLQVALREIDGAPPAPLATPRIRTPAMPASGPKTAPGGSPKMRAATGSAALTYVVHVEKALQDATSLRQVLQDIDRKAAVSPELLQAAQTQLGSLRNVVDGLRPPSSLAETHDLLRTAVGFAVTALTLTSASSAEVSANASSAAAGALMIFDKVQAELRTTRKDAPAQFVGQ